MTMQPPSAVWELSEASTALAEAQCDCDNPFRGISLACAWCLPPWIFVVGVLLSY